MKKLFLKPITFLLLFLWAGSSLLQGQGVLTGTVTDQTSGETIIGANVYIEGTTIGTSTDFDGKYQFKAAPGTYSVVVAYVGYQEKIITGVELKDGETTYLDVVISDAAIELDLEVVVEAKAIERSENALLSLQRKSDKIQDGISAQEMTRLGVSDAAAAMGKMTGATVQDGRFIFVRGLGDRYSNAQLNGVTMPSTDPYRNSAQLDLVPSNLLDNIVVSKSFSPDQPGTFTGGNVNLKTKSFPEQFTLKVTTSVAYNSQSSFNENFLSHGGGSLDWLGFDDGGRQLPDVLQDSLILENLTRGGVIRARNNDSLAMIIDRAVNSLNSQMVPVKKQSPLDYGMSVALGNQTTFLGKPMGILMSMNYSNKFRHYSNGVAANYELKDPAAASLGLNFLLADTRSVESPSLGGMVGLSYKLSSTDNISANVMYNHSADIVTRYQVGEHRDFEVFSPEVFESRTLHFMERALLSGQLQGEHVLPTLNNMKIEWVGSVANSMQNEPDLRFFANEYDATKGLYGINKAKYNLPTHFFRELEDKRYESKVDITIPVLQSAGLGNKIKIGGLYAQKDRVFSEARFKIEEDKAELYQGDADAFFGTENSGWIGETESGRNIIGNYLENDTRAENSYTGSSKVWATYLMGTFQIARPLKVIGGLRLENTDILVQSVDTGSINKLDFLPALSTVYALNNDMNLRASYSHTIARPNMRELAPFASFEFIGDAIYLGNPNLERTKIRNMDLRWEWFPNLGEVVALSAYYKQFENPIVRAFSITSNPEFRFENVDQAEVYGIELELRKQLGFISPRLENFKLGTNISFIKSVVDIPSQELSVIQQYNPEADDKRPFQGQSPFIFNLNLNYFNEKSGIDATLAYNIFGERLAVVGQNGTPDIYEQPRGQLDFSISRNVTDKIALKASAQNILNTKYETSSSYRGNDFVYSSYSRGVTYGLSLSYTIR